jgi:hypothetical protein
VAAPCCGARVGGGLERIEADARTVSMKRSPRQALRAVGVDHASITSGTSSARTTGRSPCRHRRAAERAAVGAAERDLVPLLAVLVDAEDADVAAVVVAAGVDAAADVQVDVADVVAARRGRRSAR